MSAYGMGSFGVYGFRAHTSARAPCRQILVAEPSERITMAEIQRHPWFVRDLPEGVAQMNSALLAQQQAAGGQ